MAIHVFSRAFLEREAARPLPLHVAHKKIPVCGDDGATVAPNGYKFEKFIFDVLPDARHVLNLAFDRADEFSPVKNAAGADSPATCLRDLSAKWARWLEAAGVAVPRGADGFPSVPVEIDPCFALDAAELQARLAAGPRPDANRPIWLRDAS